MNSLEGSGNVISISREDFIAGPRRPHIEKNLSRHALAPVFYLTGGVEKLAPVTQLPNALAEPLEPMDEVLEILVETDIISGIIGELKAKQLDDEALQIVRDCKQLVNYDYSQEDILSYVLAYTKKLDEDLHTKALLALDIIKARESIVDIEEFASLRTQA